jgi:NAD(P)-dependent dehydrogenase (short-subunit alcohol dehydrogenase family)
MARKSEKLTRAVTGANQGIGFQIARELAARRLTVLVGSRDLVKGKKAAEEIGENAHPIQIDVTDQA